MSNPLDLTNEQEEFISDLMNKMTIDEKIGQLNQPGPSPFGGFGVSLETQKKLYDEGQITKEEYERILADTNAWNHQEDDIREGKVGSILGLVGAERCNHLQKIAVEESRLGIPIIFGFDVIHGHNVTFPIPLAESCCWDDDIWEKNAELAAVQASADGIHWTFAPMVDIARDARWGRIAEGAGEDTYLGCRCAAARVKGFQGNDVTLPGRVMACAKHFTAYGAAESGRDYNTVDMSDYRLFETYLPPFKAAVDAGVGTFMAAFNDLNGIPCTINSYLLKKILRDDWGFKGIVVSDCNAVSELINHGSATDEKDAAYKSLKNGNDMDMNSRCYINHLKELYDDGQISEKQIDESVRNILRVKVAKGLFEHPYTQLKYSDFNVADHRAASRKAAGECAVLLKNKEVLPLSNKEKFLLVGELADNCGEMHGTWSLCAVPSDGISIKQGLENRNTNFEYIPCCGPHSSINKDQLEYVINRPEKVVVAVVGEISDYSGEGASLCDINLPGDQNKLLKALKDAGKTVITILINGRPMAIPEATQASDAMLELWHAGCEAGNAAADLLFGDVNPSGRLTVTFPNKSGECPAYYCRPNTGRPGSGSSFTSRYIDAPISPLFPFGFGLSYTTFEYSDFETQIINEGINCKITVKNTGTRDGKETVQLYIRDIVASRVRPVLELKNFKKISLKAGESQKVNLLITPENLSFYNTEMKKIIEPGEFMIQMGHDSVSGKRKKIFVDQNTISNWLF